jgi:hypothetical protein
MIEQKLQDTDPNTFNVEKDDFCVVNGVRYEVGLVGHNENHEWNRRIVVATIPDLGVIAVDGGAERHFIADTNIIIIGFTRWKFHKPLPKKTMRPMNAKEMYALIREGRLFRNIVKNFYFKSVKSFDIKDNVVHLDSFWSKPEELEYLDDDLNPVPCMVEVAE